MATETQVYRLLSPNFDDSCSQPNNCFSTEKCYKTALYTKKTGRWPDEKYFTTKPLRYVGKFVRTERQGFGNGATVTEIFNNMGKEIEVELDYDGKTCFVETPCLSNSEGGKRRMKKTRKSKKTRKQRKYSRKH